MFRVAEMASPLAKHEVRVVGSKPRALRPCGRKQGLPHRRLLCLCEIARRQANVRVK